MKIAINLLKEGIEWANNFIRTHDLVKNEIDLKKKQIAIIEKAIKILEDSKQHDNK